MAPAVGAGRAAPPETQQMRSAVTAYEWRDFTQGRISLLGRSSRSAVVGVALLVGLTTACESTKQAPAVTHDGLHRVAGSKMQNAYLKPGVDFSQYSRLQILDCYVAFKKNWKTAHSGVTKRDIESIKQALAVEFRKVFVEELEHGGYPVVAEADSDVLLVRPAIIDLDVVAPDRMSAGRSESFSASSGAMTLYVELYDSVSGEILARASDRETSRLAGRIQWTNRGTNISEARKMLTHWAGLLRRKLDEVHGREAG